MFGLPENTGHERPIRMSQTTKPDAKWVLVLVSNSMVRNFRSAELSKLVRVESVDGIGDAGDCVGIRHEVTSD